MLLLCRAKNAVSLALAVLLALPACAFPAFSAPTAPLPPSVPAAAPPKAPASSPPAHVAPPSAPASRAPETTAAPAASPAPPAPAVPAAPHNPAAHAPTPPQAQQAGKPGTSGDAAPPAPPLLSPMEEAARAYARGDHTSARIIWERQAGAGDGQAMNNLGVLYDLGQGVEPDTGRALHWYAQSAGRGYPAGMSNYGRMLEQGRGIAANPQEAARWFDLAAREGLPEAQYNLGMLYELGRGVSKDAQAAAAWYSRAAMQNQTDALARLGHMYRVGQGVNADAARATLLLYAAAMNGDAGAMRELEEMAAAQPRAEAVLLGQRLDSTNREAMRAVLKKYGAKPVREDAAYICDIYEAGRIAPGAHRLSACYGPGNPAPLGFLELDYPAAAPSTAKQVEAMLSQRFGAPSAGEGEDSRLWNLGSVVVATRHEAARSVSIMYMIPRVYHLTRADKR